MIQIDKLVAQMRRDCLVQDTTQRREQMKALTVKNELDILTLGDILVQSGFFADTQQQAQAVVKVLAGAEIGFGPIASMTGVYIVKGKPALSANLIAAAVKRSGKYNYRIIEHTDNACAISFSEGGEQCGESRFSMEDAGRAGLGEQNWQKYPRNMLFARAMSNGAKWFCPDIFGGPIYTPDELGAVTDETGDVIEGQYSTATPPTPPVTPATSTPDGLTEAQRAAFAHVTPGGKQLGKQSPEELTSMVGWANGNPDNAAAQTLKQHCEVLLDYLGQLEAHPEEADEDIVF